MIGRGPHFLSSLVSTPPETACITFINHHYVHTYIQLELNRIHSLLRSSKSSADKFSCIPQLCSVRIIETAGTCFGSSSSGGDGGGGDRGGLGAGWFLFLSEIYINMYILILLAPADEETPKLACLSHFPHDWLAWVQILVRASRVGNDSGR